MTNRVLHINFISLFASENFIAIGLEIAQAITASSSQVTNNFSESLIVTSLVHQQLGVNKTTFEIKIEANIAGTTFAAKQRAK